MHQILLIKFVSKTINRSCINDVKRKAVPIVKMGNMLAFPLYYYQELLLQTYINQVKNMLFRNDNNRSYLQIIPKL